MFWEYGTGLLEQSDGLVKGLYREVGMQLVDFGWLFIVQLAAGLWLEETGHLRVGMQLCILFNWVFFGENWWFVVMFLKMVL